MIGVQYPNKKIYSIAVTVLNTQPMQTGVMIFEDNDNLRESLSCMITYSRELLLLGCYSNAQHAVQLVQENRPDVVLMDIDMPGITGIEAVRAIHVSNQQVQVLMLTVFDDNKTCVRCHLRGRIRLPA